MTMAEKPSTYNQWKVINMHDSFSSKLSYVNYLFSKVSEEVLPLNCFILQAQRVVHLSRKILSSRKIEVAFKEQPQIIYSHS